MAVKDWDTREDGNLDIERLIAWETAKMPMNGALRLRYARNEREFETGGIALQLLLSPVQLRSLSSALANLADALDADHLGTRQ